MIRDGKGVWITTIGAPCGVTIYQKNMRRFVSNEGAAPCSDPTCWHHKVVRGEENVFEQPSVNAELEWCGCDTPEEVDRMMLAYLRSRDEKGWPKTEPEGVSADATLLLSYMAARLDWTEHGGSVGGAWLSDDGKEALANLEVIVAQHDLDDQDESGRVSEDCFGGEGKEAKWVMLR